MLDGLINYGVALLTHTTKHMEAISDKKNEAYHALLNACKEFVNKVDTGRARSTHSYNAMKAAIALHKEAEKHKWECPNCGVKPNPQDQENWKFYIYCSSCDPY